MVSAIKPADQESVNQRFRHPLVEKLRFDVCDWELDTKVRRVRLGLGSVGEPQLHDFPIEFDLGVLNGQARRICDNIALNVRHIVGFTEGFGPARS